MFRFIRLILFASAAVIRAYASIGAYAFFISLSVFGDTSTSTERGRVHAPANGYVLDDIACWSCDTSCSRSSMWCAALTLIRKRAVPAGTVGGRMAGT